MDDESIREIIFAPTPKMSTYLLAFIIGDFEYIEKKSTNGVRVRVYTVPGKKHQAKFALDCTVRTLEFYEKYFDIPYPLNTLDMIAIPDFSSLAMENWGAITFREVGLLVDEKNTSTATRELVAEVIAHELAHQWFGNLVTMEWWTHLWLNEGFASYIPYLALNELFPTWNVWEKFSAEDQTMALRLDSLKHTHPIEIEVHHPDEIGEIFDTVSYLKGASVIKMIADYLGEKNFRNGLRYYLKKHSYKNTSTVHLWKAFEEVSGKPVAKIMKNWTSKGGYPYLEVREIGTKIQVEQKRFFANPTSAKTAKEKNLWSVPLAISVGNTKPKNILFEKNKLLLESPSKLKISWLNINSGGGGFFRTAYSPELLAKFSEPLKKKDLSVQDRLGLIRDTFALAEAGIIPTDKALQLAMEYKNEDNYSVWMDLSQSLNQINTLLLNTDSSNNFKEFAREFYRDTVTKTGWLPKEGEKHDQTLLRSLLISQSGLYGNQEIITEAQNIFKAFTELNNETIPADLRSAVYSIIARNGGETEYRAFIVMYKQESLHEEKNRIGHALGLFKNIKLLKETLNFAFSKNVRLQDSLSIIAPVLMNPYGRDLAWEYTQKNWPMLLERYASGLSALSRLIKSMSGFNTRERYNDIKKFFKTHPAPGCTRAIEQILEKIDGNIQWLKRDEKAINNFLTDK